MIYTNAIFVYSIFLFSESNAVLSHRNRVKFQVLRMIKKKCDDFNIFTKILSRCAQWRSCFALTFSCEREASLNINKVGDFVMNEKNNTVISCVFNGFKFMCTSYCNLIEKGIPRCRFILQDMCCAFCRIRER